MTTEVLTRFPAGADVPEWLFAVEPMSPESIKGHFRFAIDCDVVETPDYFVILPSKIGGGFESMFVFEGSGCKLFAGAKTVHWTANLITMHTKDIQNFVPSLPCLAQVTPPKLGLMARLWKAVKG